MLKMRVIPCLDVKDGRVVKGVNFVDLVDAGDPVAQARFYDREGADELCFLDITASAEDRDTLYDVVRRTAEECFMPLTVGGGIRDRAAIERWLALGINRVVLGTAALRDPKLVRNAASDHPGRIVVGIDARDGFVAVEGWVETTELGVVELARRYADCGVAAIVYTDIARDGALCGIDANAVAGVARQIPLPVIASGGVASLDDIAALKACETDGIAGVICGRALYDGRIDPAAALRLLAEERPC